MTDNTAEPGSSLSTELIRALAYPGEGLDAARLRLQTGPLVKLTTGQVSAFANVGEPLDLARRRLEGELRKATTLSSLAGMIESQEAEKVQAEEAGMPALRRLLQVAGSDTGQARICGLFLLSLYDGARYPFNLRDMRGLDKSLHDDCLAVLQLDHAPDVEIHERVGDGQYTWGRMIVRWGAQEPEG